MTILCGEPQIGREERLAVRQVLKSGRLTRGQECRDFEAGLRRHLGRPALAVSSGTAALHLALLGVGVGRGDEVILPATTFVATVNAVLYCGAKPVVVDVDGQTWTIRIDDVRRMITKRTKAILPVHLYGVPADMGAILQIVNEHYRRTGQYIAVVEDAAEALGAVSYGKPAGSVGDTAAFSFYGSKTITTGEGGAVSWRDPVVGDRVFHLHGQALEANRRYWHDTVGFNYRMTEVQAALGRVQLGRLDEFLAKRSEVFGWYEESLPENFRRQKMHSLDDHGYWAFAVQRYGMNAEAVGRQMLAQGIETRPIFPPVSSFPHVPGDPPPAARFLHENGLVLPTHCGLTRDDVEVVCRALVSAASSS